jgi:hypothetical protein
MLSWNVPSIRFSLHDRLLIGDTDPAITKMVISDDVVGGGIANRGPINAQHGSDNGWKGGVIGFELLNMSGISIFNRSLPCGPDHILDGCGESTTAVVRL